jgi:hypothetical protein
MMAAYTAWAEAEAARYDFWDALAARAQARTMLRHIHRENARREGPSYNARRATSPALVEARRALRTVERQILRAHAAMWWWEDTALECWVGYLECAAGWRQDTPEEAWSAFLADVCGGADDVCA